MEIKRHIILVVAAASTMSACAGPAAAASAATSDIGSEVQSIFAAKCTNCHGADLPNPKCRFGYVLNLPRIASNPEMVVPASPDESELWVLVRRGEMPPSESPQGPLSNEQKETIRRWIERGAPDVEAKISSAPQANSTAEQINITGSGDKESSWFERWLGRLGKFHLLVLHFPIAFSLAAAAGECWSIVKRFTTPSAAVRLCLWLAAVAAIPTATLGWLYAAGLFGGGEPSLLQTHRWLGTASAVILIITAVLAERDLGAGQRSRIVRLLILTAAVLTAATAHFGGLMVHGPDFFAIFD